MKPTPEAIRVWTILESPGPVGRASLLGLCLWRFRQGLVVHLKCLPRAPWVVPVCEKTLGN
jgi:hypothetical protein